MTHGYFDIMFMEFNKEMWIGSASESEKYGPNRRFIDPCL